MIENDLNAMMSGHHTSSQEYRAMDEPPPPPAAAGDLQCLSWLTSVDVPRLQSRVRPQHTGRLLASSLPQSILGLSTVSRYAPLFPPPPTSCQEQQAFTIAQQCPPQAAIYSHSSYALQQQQQTQYAPPRIAPLNNNAQEMHPKHYPKPIYSYSCLIAMALKNSQTGSLPVSEIYSFMKEHFPYFKTAPDGWKNSVRHNLSLNKCFTKVESKASSSSSSSRKGCLWALNPAKVSKMEEEMQKWKRKDLPAIHRSMANPEELDKLITDRPENCRRKPAEAEAARNIPPRPAQPPPQPVMALPLPPLSLHHQVQAQSCMAPDSPAPAQTPPLHALCGMGHGSPLPPPMMPPPPPHGVLLRGPDFLSAVMADMNAEVDALDPSIMDFALQGNIWDEIKDESFNLDSLGAFSNSPLPLSDCDLASAAGLNPACNGSDHSFADLQVTGLYATYATLDAAVSSSSYLGAQGNKPITLH